MPPDCGYREIPHTADLGLEVRGASQVEFLTFAAAGLSHLLCCEPAADAMLCEHAIHLQSPDLETLLVAWLNELIYLCEEHHVCPERFDIHAASDTELRAVVHGICPWRTHRVIKAATFHNLVVSRGVKGYQAQITLDV
ncbi:MAG: archease [Anaerolineae bacterium]